MNENTDEGIDSRKKRWIKEWKNELIEKWVNKRNNIGSGTKKEEPNEGIGEERNKIMQASGEVKGDKRKEE